MSQSIPFYKETVDLTELESQNNRNQLDFLEKKICTHFEPFKEYFSQQPIAQILTSKPKFKPTISKNLRDNLKLQRQLMYVKKSMQSDYGNEILEQYINDNNYEHIQKIKNTSLIFLGYLYWCQQTKINRLKIDKYVKKMANNSSKECYSIKKGQSQELLDIHQSINELQQHKAHLYIRTTRKIIVYSIYSKKIIKQNKIREQIINFQIYSSREMQKFMISTYEEETSSMFSYSNEQDEPVLLCKIDGVVNSIMPLTANSSIICKDNAILLIDERCKLISQMHRRLNPKNNRIYSGISLKHTRFGQRYMAVSQSYSVNIYDIRKSHESIIKIPHFCEESPPTILQIHEMSLQNQKEMSIQDVFEESLFNQWIDSLSKGRQDNKDCLLIAHSHYQTGSSLLAELNVYFQSEDQKFMKEFKSQVNQFSNKFQLLYHAGLIHQGYHPLSISPIQLGQNIGFFHIDNYHGISMEILTKTSHNKSLKNYKQSNSHNSLYQRVVEMVVQEGIQGVKNPNSQWFANNQLQSHIALKKDDFWTKTLSSEMDIELEPNRHQENVVRFADLKKFYENLQANANGSQIQQLLKLQEQKLKKASKSVHIDKSKEQGNTLTFSTQNSFSFSNLLLSQEDITQILNQWHNVDN